MSSYTTERIKYVSLLLLVSGLFWYSLEGMEIQTIAYLIPLLFALQIILTDLIEYYLVINMNSQTRWFSIFMAPGTILHELTHFFAALITGCTVMKVSLFKPNPKTGVLGFVSYQQPIDKWTVIRDITVGLSPFFGCGIFLLLLNLLYGGGLLDYALELNITSIHELPSIVSEIIENFWVNISSLNIQSVLSIVLFYLQITFAFGAASSSVDLKGSFSSLYKHPFSTLFLVILLIIMFFLSTEPFEIGEASYYISNSIFFVFSISLILLVISQIILLISIPLLLIGIQYIQLRDYEKTIPIALTLGALLITKNTSFGFNPLFLGGVFSSVTLLLKNKRHYLK